MWGKISIRKSDKLFREYLLKLRGERCEYCGRVGKVEVSHFHGRRHENTRFSEKNCSLICNYHHRYFHENPSIYTEWMQKKLGNQEFKKLTLEANRIKKRDDKLQVIILKSLLLGK